MTDGRTAAPPHVSDDCLNCDHDQEAIWQASTALKKLGGPQVDSTHIST